jgi:hypothetical protein
MSPKKQINQRSSDEERMPKGISANGVIGRNKHAGRAGTRDRKRAETRLVLVPDPTSAPTSAPNDEVLKAVIDEWLVPCLIKQFLAERSHSETASDDSGRLLCPTNPEGSSNKLGA